MFLKELKKTVVSKDYIYSMYNASPRPLKSGYCPTLTAGMGTYENHIPVVLDSYGIRKLTLEECLRFQGFPQDFHFPNSISIKHAYKQIGNSVCIPIIKRIAQHVSLVLAD